MEQVVREERTWLEAVLYRSFVKDIREDLQRNLGEHLISNSSCGRVRALSVCEVGGIQTGWHHGRC